MLRKNKTIPITLNILAECLSTDGFFTADLLREAVDILSQCIEKLNSSVSFGKLLVVSSHLDDAVFSCGELIARRNRLAALLQARIEATPLSAYDDGARHMKRQAVHCYASQLQALSRIGPDHYADAFAPERFWQLTSAQTVSEAATHG